LFAVLRKIISKMISNQNQNHLLENDLKSKSQFKNLISNRDFKLFDSNCTQRWLID